mmetsp:Transcript_529/g.685  ORF Transcript_529/g.685 Transcript_529/m.685 type:complete len:308 (-) Transcript_529:1902-2825(-)
MCLKTYLLSATTALALVQRGSFPTQLRFPLRSIGSNAKQDNDIVITSTTNRIVKEARLLHTRRGRFEQNLVLLEGIRLITDSAQTCDIDTLILAEGVDLNVQAKRIVRVSDRVLKACGTTTTPQGALALCRPPQLKLPTYPNLVLACDNISDPGNVGTLIRTAAAIGTDAILIVGSQSCDQFSPKALRAAMGATFRLPLHRSDSWTEAMKLLRHEWNLHVRAADLDPLTSQDHDLVDWLIPSAIIVGAEVGLSDDLLTLLDEKYKKNDSAFSRVHIPIMNGAVESLNAAVAGSVILLEAHRQRLRSR